MAFDRVRSITNDQFCTMLDKTLPRDACAPACRDDSGAGRPFDLGLTVSCVHLLFADRCGFVIPNQQEQATENSEFELVTWLVIHAPAPASTT